MMTAGRIKIEPSFDRWQGNVFEDFLGFCACICTTTNGNFIDLVGLCFDSLRVAASRLVSIFRMFRLRAKRSNYALAESDRDKPAVANSTLPDHRITLPLFSGLFISRIGEPNPGKLLSYLAKILRNHTWPEIERKRRTWEFFKTRIFLQIIHLWCTLPSKILIGIDPFRIGNPLIGTSIRNF